MGIVFNILTSATILLMLTLFLPGIKNESFLNTVYLVAIVSFIDSIITYFLGIIGLAILIPLNAYIFLHVGEMVSVYFENFKSALICSVAYVVAKFLFSILLGLRL